MTSPRAQWMEQTFGIQAEGDSFRRRVPIRLTEGAEKLAELTGIEVDKCAATIREMFLTGAKLRHEDDTPVFAVKLHQFISKGESVYATFSLPEHRKLTFSGQRYGTGR